MKKKRILIIEDDKDYQDLISESLHADFELSFTKSIEDGKKKFETSKFHLVITDLRLPLNNEDCDEKANAGWMVVNCICNKIKNIPLVLITAFGGANIRKRAESEGVHGYLEKGKDFSDKLISLVNEILIL